MHIDYRRKIKFVGSWRRTVLGFQINIFRGKLSIPEFQVRLDLLFLWIEYREFLVVVWIYGSWLMLCPFCLHVVVFILHVWKTDEFTNEVWNLLRIWGTDENSGMMIIIMMNKMMNTLHDSLMVGWVIPWRESIAKTYYGGLSNSMMR